MRFLLCRHAKAVSASGSTGDFERVLSEKGRRDAVVVRGRLKEHGFLPEKVFSSSAKRAVETASIVFPDTDIVLIDALYHSSGEGVVEFLRSIDNDCFAVVGHNPSMEEAVFSLTGRLYSMGTSDCIAFEGDWENGFEFLWRVGKD
ncbi:histidine phosphatase family protein [Spirochaetia bacterium 38H-sp]|uniref:Histidine phosphatase family protein n=1 Tax=Rarispira pelagica TaxID=3141764 RepID=A0ABU9U9D2_9SPIR